MWPFTKIEKRLDQLQAETAELRLRVKAFEQEAYEKNETKSHTTQQMLPGNEPENLQNIANLLNSYQISHITWDFPFKVGEIEESLSQYNSKTNTTTHE